MRMRKTFIALLLGSSAMLTTSAGQAQESDAEVTSSDADSSVDDASVDDASVDDASVVDAGSSIVDAGPVAGGIDASLGTSVGGADAQVGSGGLDAGPIFADAAASAHDGGAASDAGAAKDAGPSVPTSQDLMLPDQGCSAAGSTKTHGLASLLLVLAALVSRRRRA